MGYQFSSATPPPLRAVTRKPTPIEVALHQWARRTWDIGSIGLYFTGPLGFQRRVCVADTENLIIAGHTSSPASS